MASAHGLRDTGNSLLDRLPHDEYDLLKPLLQTVALALKQVVHEYDAEVAHVHFPTTALMSILAVLEEDDPVETATVGKEGFIGLSMALGVSESPNRVICQMAGESLRLPIRPFAEAMAKGRGLPSLVYRYVAFSLRTTGQAIACNALHPVDMLGVRRQTVTVVAGALQNAGLISYRRGVILVRDRQGLEDAACECYATGRDYYERIMS